MKALILGGDGYCGWPLTLRLSARGFDVAIVDNGSRRMIDKEIGASSLVSIVPLDTRIAAWRELTGVGIDVNVVDISRDYDALAALMSRFQPDVIVHLAEQRSVPYSMDSRAGGIYTIRNNIMGMTHVLESLAATGLDAHLVHLGSIGVYGYETLGYEIPEGYQTVRRVGIDGSLAPAEKMLHPFRPVSKYHLTKALDHVSLAYYAAAHGIRATDLHQGTVWGAETKETAADPRLANRFDYDATFGTVLNRYALQVALGLPISVYGTGEQTRGFIHLDDVLDCIELAISSPPDKGGPVRVINEIAQTMRIKDLAALFAGMSESPVTYLPSPRSEPAENELKARNDGLKALGIDPRIISAESVSEIIDFAREHARNAKPEMIYPPGFNLDSVVAEVS